MPNRDHNHHYDNQEGDDDTGPSSSSSSLGCSGEAIMCASPGSLLFRAGGRRPVVACFGDSHTHGFHGPNWVSMLQSRYPNMRFLNCGWNGEVLESITNRVEGTLRAHHRDVVAVVLLGGTNDCLGNLSPSTASLIKMYNPWIKEVPKVEAYRATARRFLETVQRYCPQARVGWLTLPLITEDLDSPPNAVINTINGMIREVAARYPSPRVTVLDLNHSMKRYLETHPRPHDAPEPLEFVPSFSVLFGYSAMAVVRGTVVFESWNAIAESRGASLLSDHIHLTERSVALLLELVVPFIEAVRQEAKITTPVKGRSPATNSSSDNSMATTQQQHNRRMSKTSTMTMRHLHSQQGEDQTVLSATTTIVKKAAIVSDQLTLATPHTDPSSPIAEEGDLTSPVFSSPVSQRDLDDVEISLTSTTTTTTTNGTTAVQQTVVGYTMTSHHSKQQQQHGGRGGSTLALGGEEDDMAARVA